MNRDVIWEAIKEPLRLMVLSIVPLLIVYFTDLGYEWAGAAIVVLRFLDSWLHEWGKETKNDTLTTGLTRF